MQFDLTIAGAAKQLKAGSLRIHQQANGRSTASFDIDSSDRSYRPAIDAEVIMDEDGTRIFGGVIQRPRERGQFGPLRPGIRTGVSAVDFHVYTEWRFVEGDFPEQTLKARLQSIITDILTDYGVTLHGSQVDGPTLPALTYDRHVRLDAFLNEQMKLTADAGQPFVWRISNTKVLRAYQPSTVPAPFDLVGNDLPEVVGDIEVEHSNEGKANQILVELTPKQGFALEESFTWDVDPYPYELNSTVFAHRGYVVHDGSQESLAESGADWTLSGGNTLTRNLGSPGYVFFPAEPAYLFANTDLTGSVTNVSNGDTITIDGLTYTFESAFTNTARKILIGATASISKARLVGAIEADGSMLGTVVGAGTTQHSTVTAYIPAEVGGGPNTGETITLEARTAGVGGNGIVVSQTGAVLRTFWEGNTNPGELSGGADASSLAQVTTISYDGAMFGTFTATDPTWTSTPSSRRQKVLQVESVASNEAAQAFADAELAKSLTGPITVRYKTWEQGLEPGMSQTVNVSARNVNESGLITEVVISDLVHRLVRQVTVIVDDAQTNLDRKWGDLYRAWLGDKGGSGTATVGAGPISQTGPAPPDESIQSNQGGSFSGNASFLFQRSTESVLLGSGSAISATMALNVLAVGPNLTVTD